MDVVKTGEISVAVDAGLAAENEAAEDADVAMADSRHSKPHGNGPVGFPYTPGPSLHARTPQSSGWNYGASSKNLILTGPAATTSPHGPISQLCFKLTIGPLQPDDTN